MSKRKKYRRRHWPFIIGTLFLVAAVAVVLWNYHADVAAGKKAATVLEEMHTVIPTPEAPDTAQPVWDSTDIAQEVFAEDIFTEQQIPDYILNPAMEMPAMEIEGNLYIGTLFFPALDLELPVMSSWSYPNLTTAPCLYTGSIYKQSAVIAAHNYISHFGRLTELAPGDVVVFTDVDGSVFTYEIVVQEVLAPTAIDEMTETDFDLSLFTCTLGGGSRFTVRCELLASG